MILVLFVMIAGMAIGGVWLGVFLWKEGGLAPRAGAVLSVALGLAFGVGFVMDAPWKSKASVVCDHQPHFGKCKMQVSYYGYNAATKTSTKKYRDCGCTNDHGMEAVKE